MVISAATLVPSPELQFVDDNGVPYVDGQLYTYIPNTSTFKDTWIDSGEATLNTNPITLDSAGRCIVWGTGSYRFLLKDSLGNTVFDQITEAAGGEGGTYLNVQTLFGASGDGASDDTAAIQSGLDYIVATGGVLYFPTGKYRITSALTATFTYTTVNSVNRPSIKGDGPGNSQILWDGANSPATFMMTLQRTESVDGQGLHAHSVIEGIGFLPISSGKNQFASGLKLSKWAYLHLRDVWFHRLNYGLWLDQVLSSQFDSIVARVNNYGLYGIGAPTSSLTAVYGTNALTFTACVFGNNLLGGFSNIDGTVYINGGSIEGNGQSGSAGSGYGAKFSNSGAGSPIALNIIGTYFEANGTTGNLGANASTADIWILDPNALDNMNYNIRGCNFNRLVSTYAPHCIYIDKTSTRALNLYTTGNTFTNYTSYTPSSSRKYVIINDTSGATGAGVPVVTDQGNYYNQSVEIPDYNVIAGVKYYVGLGYRAGAIVYPSVQQSIPNGTTTAIVFSTAIYNNYGIWSAGDPTKLTVPANVSYVKITGNIRFDATTTGSSVFVVLLQKNASATFNGNPRFSQQSGTTATLYEMNIASAIIPVSAGDYFTLCVSQGTGGALNTSSVFTSQWFSMEIIG